MLTRVLHVQQRQAHEQPVIFYSCVLGVIGPLMVFTVPPIRERMGYKPPERPPTTYPCVFIFTARESMLTICLVVQYQTVQEYQYQATTMNSAPSL